MHDDSRLLDVSLERAAEAVGDLTETVLARFYTQHPEARQAFEHHSPGEPEKLEAEMVANALYCAMNWLDRPGEVRIQVNTSVPHHEDTLHVALPWYRGLQETVIDVIFETIPANEAAELTLWRRIRAELGEIIQTSSWAAP